MTINKFQGKTKEEAIEKAKAEFGPNAVIMNIKEVKRKGILGIFFPTTYEVTAAIEEKEPVYATTPNGMVSNTKQRENINLAADEEIAIPQPTRIVPKEEVKVEAKEIIVDRTLKAASVKVQEEEKSFEAEKQFKERLDNLSELLEQKLSSPTDDEMLRKSNSQDLNFVRMIYNTLLKNEVNEKYINQVLDEVEKFIRLGNNVDLILPNIYQKLVNQL